MFVIVWSDEAFDEMGQIILRPLDRRAEFAAALRDANNRLSAARSAKASPGTGTFGSWSPGPSRSTSG
jgi:hypothetical protein